MDKGITPRIDHLGHLYASIFNTSKHPTAKQILQYKVIWDTFTILWVSWIISLMTKSTISKYTHKYVHATHPFVSTITHMSGPAKRLDLSTGVSISSPFFGHVYYQFSRFFTVLFRHISTHTRHKNIELMVHIHICVEWVSYCTGVGSPSVGVGFKLWYHRFFAFFHLMFSHLLIAISPCFRPHKPRFDGLDWVSPSTSGQSGRPAD